MGHPELSHLDNGISYRVAPLHPPPTPNSPPPSGMVGSSGVSEICLCRISETRAAPIACRNGIQYEQRHGFQVDSVVPLYACIIGDPIVDGIYISVLLTMIVNHPNPKNRLSNLWKSLPISIFVILRRCPSTPVTLDKTLSNFRLRPNSGTCHQPLSTM